MKDYVGTQMAEKKHAKAISSQLRKLGSKTPAGICLARNRSLANLLRLACGGGKYSFVRRTVKSYAFACPLA